MRVSELRTRFRPMSTSPVTQSEELAGLCALEQSGGNESGMGPASCRMIKPVQWVPINMSSSSSSSSNIVNHNGSTTMDDYRRRHQQRYEEREAEEARQEQEDADWELAQTLQSHEEIRLKQEMDLRHAEEVHRQQEMEQRHQLTAAPNDSPSPTHDGVRRPMRTGYTERLIDDGPPYEEEPSAGFPSWCPFGSFFRSSRVSERELVPLRDPDEEAPTSIAERRIQQPLDSSSQQLNLVARHLSTDGIFVNLRWFLTAAHDSWRCCRCFVHTSACHPPVTGMPTPDREKLIDRAMELQRALSELTYKAEEVRLQNAALEEENDLLKEYIENLITRLGTLPHLSSSSALPPRSSAELMFKRRPRPEEN
ncbi:hypothetical protein FOL47_001897 [Perkinsus chesapeaki]|uniref:Uncharacterized protein n=1 Tax=Perkinsus chesapeaki TaxID=330153 RepID=A0A7J6MGL2_PERCH|nr:hypothetical protein FOL47_001897 [Perkinsus chesapeaki]